MDIEIYREFTILATHRSFVAAARELNMSQPSLSRHINALQTELGCKLFYDTRPLSLTASGETVLKYAGKIVGDEANMLADLKKLSATKNSRITVVDLLHTNTLYLGLSEAISEAKKQFSGLRIDYLDMNDSGLSALQMVENGKVNISFETTITSEPAPPLEVPESLRSIWVPEFHGELIIGVEKGSPLAGRTDLTLKELERSRFVLQANRCNERFKEDFIKMCHEAGFYPNITLVPTDNPLSFYASSFDDGIHLISRVDKKYPTLMGEILKRNMDFASFSDKKRYVNAYAIMKDDFELHEINFIAEYLEDHAEAFR